MDAEPRALKAAAAYFALLVAAGFALGPIRVVWLAPRIGERNAVLLELPLMLVIGCLAAAWLVRRFDVPAVAQDRLVMGGVALGLVLLAEFALVLPVRGMGIREYLENFDPVAGVAYYATLVLLALAPTALAWKEKP